MTDIPPQKSTGKTPTVTKTWQPSSAELAQIQQQWSKYLNGNQQYVNQGGDTYKIAYPYPGQTPLNEPWRANERQFSYWEYPQRVARYYDMIRAASPEWKPPEWLDVNKVQEAYDYLKYRNEGRPTQEWKALPVDDPGTRLLQGMGRPPVQYLMPSEITYSDLVKTQEQVDAQKPIDWSQLDEPGYKWMKTYLTLFSPQSEGITGRPESSKLVASIGQALLPSLGVGAALGAVSANPIVGAIGVVASTALLTYQNYTGNQVPGLNAIMRPFNYLAEATESTIGNIALGSKYGLDEVFDDPEAAYRAGLLNYETMKMSNIPNWFAKTADLLNPMDVTTADKDEIWKISSGMLKPVEAPHGKGAEALKYYHEWIQSGAAQDEYNTALNEGNFTGRYQDYIYQKAMSEYGDTAIANDMVFQTVLDPLNVMPWAIGKTGGAVAGKIAKTAKDPATIRQAAMWSEVLKEGTGNIMIDALPIGLQQLVSGVLKKSQSRGVIENLNVYRDHIRNYTFPKSLMDADADIRVKYESLVKEGVDAANIKHLDDTLVWKDKNGVEQVYKGKPGIKFEVPKIEDLSPLEKFIGGIDDVYGLKELRPTIGKKFLTKFTSLTPDAQVSHILTAFHHNIATLMDSAGGDPARMTDLIQKLSGRVEVKPGELGYDMINSPANKAVMAAMQWAFRDGDIAGNELGRWLSGGERRSILEKVAYALNETVADVLTQLQDNPDVMAQRLNKIAPELNTTGKDLTTTLKVFVGEDAMPWNAEQFQARLVNAIATKMDDFFVEKYGLKQDSWVFRASNALKGVQSLVLLGFNPAYFMNNWVNNVVTRAADGIGGYMTNKQVNDFYTRFGIFPKDSGLSMYDDITGAVIKNAKEASNDVLSKAQKTITFLNKAGVFSRLSHKIEKLEGGQARVIAMNQYLDKTKKVGQGIRKMDAAIEITLDSKYPGLKERIYNAVNAGMNMKEIEQSLFSTEIRPHIENIIDDIETKYPGARDLLRKTNLTERLRDELANVKTAEDLELAFENVRNAWESWVDEQTSKKIINGVDEEAKNVTQAERIPFVLKTFGDMILDQAKRWLGGRKEWDDLYAQEGTLRDAGMWDTSVRKLERKQRAEWERARDYEIQTHKGIIEAIGIENEHSRAYVTQIGEYHDIWKTYWTERARLYDEYYSYRRGKDQTKEAYYAEKQRLWDKLQDAQEKLYEDATSKEFEVQRRMDAEFAAMYEQYTGWDATGAAKWRAELWNMRKKIVDEQKAMRKRTKNMTPEERAQAYKDFNPGYNKLIADMHQFEHDGAYKLMNKPVPEAKIEVPQPSAVPGEPEIAGVTGDLREEAKKSGFTDEQLDNMYPWQAAEAVNQRLRNEQRAKNEQLEKAKQVVKAKITAEDIYKQADQAKRQAIIHENGMLARSDVEDGFVQAFPMAERGQVTVAMTLIDQFIDTWAKRNGLVPSEAVRDAWYATRIGSIERGDGTVAKGALEKLDQLMQTEQQARIINTPEFKRWFGDSKVVDADGNPLVMYHGTGSAGFEEFDLADPYSMYGLGYYFTENTDIASGYAKRRLNFTNSKLEPFTFDSIEILDANKSKLFIDRIKERDAGSNEYHWFINDLEKYATTENGELIAREVLQNTLDYESYWKVFQETADELGIKLTPKMNGEAVLPVYLSIKKPFDAEGWYEAEEVRQIYESANKLTGAKIPGYYSAKYGKRLFQDLIGSIPLKNIDGPNKPLGFWTTQILRDAGYDGITHIGGGNTNSVAHRVYIAFDNTQIKSIFNQGTFDPNNPNILKQNRDTLHFGGRNLDHVTSPNGKYIIDKVADGYRLTFTEKGKRVIETFKNGGEAEQFALGHAKVNNPSELYQGISPKGSYQLMEDGRAIIKGFQQGDISSMVHEIGHVFRRDLSDADMDIVAQHGGLVNGAELRELEIAFATGQLVQGTPEYAKYVNAEEEFARGWERYLAEGDAPTPQLKSVFRQFTDWMLNIYKSLRKVANKLTGVESTPLKVDITAKVNGQSLKDVFDRMLTDKVERIPTYDSLVTTKATDIKNTGRNHRFNDKDLATMAHKELIGDILGRYDSEDAARKALTDMQDYEYLKDGTAIDDATIADALKYVAEHPEVDPWVRKEIPQHYGAKTSVRGIADPTTEYPLTFKVIDLDDIQASNVWKGDQLIPNPDYLQELQPRDRATSQSVQQTEKIARTLVPDKLLDKQYMVLDDGAPIVGTDNMVESGNGRVLSLKRAAESYPDKFAEYQDALKSIAQEYGIDPASFADMSKPVLVRESQHANMDERIAFVNDANGPKTLQMSPTEMAVNDANKISDPMLLKLDVLDNEDLTAALSSERNNKFINAFLEKLNDNERGAITTDGKINLNGVNRIVNALFYRVFPGVEGERLLSLFGSTQGNSIKALQSAIMASLPQLSVMEGKIANGIKGAELSIAGDIITVADRLAYLKDNGITAGEYLDQMSMFADPKDAMTVAQKQMLRFFDSQKQSAKMRKFIREYAGLVDNEPDAKQVITEGQFRRTKEELLNDAIERATGQGGLFDFTGDTRTDATVPDQVRSNQLAESDTGTGAEIRGTQPAEQGVPGMGDEVQSVAGETTSEPILTPSEIAKQVISTETKADYDAGKPIPIEKAEGIDLTHQDTLPVPDEVQRIINTADNLRFAKKKQAKDYLAWVIDGEKDAQPSVAQDVIDYYADRLDFLRDYAAKKASGLSIDTDKFGIYNEHVEGPTNKQLNDAAASHLSDLPTDLLKKIFTKAHEGATQEGTDTSFHMWKPYWRDASNLHVWLRDNMGKDPNISLLSNGYRYSSDAGSIVLETPSRKGEPTSIVYTASTDRVAKNITQSGINITKVFTFKHGDIDCVANVYKDGELIAYMPATPIKDMRLDENTRILGLDPQFPDKVVYEQDGQIKSVDTRKPVIDKPLQESDNYNRAPAGGIIGMNGEFYPGGTFLPNTTLPKLTPEQRKANKFLSAKQEIAPFSWELPPSENVVSIFKILGGALPFDKKTNQFSFDNVSQNTIDYLGGTTRVKELVDAYNNGAKWIDKSVAMRKPEVEGQSSLFQRGQLDMFSQTAEDLPLFSGTPMSAEDMTFNPRDTSGQMSMFPDVVPQAKPTRIIEIAIKENGSTAYIRLDLKKTKAIRDTLALHPGAEMTARILDANGKVVESNLDPQKVVNPTMGGNALFQLADNTNTPEFRNWFRNSKVVDADGNPKVVYHGTPNGGFTEFDLSLRGTRSTGKVDDSRALHFTDNYDTTTAYSEAYLNDTQDIEYSINGEKKIMKATGEIRRPNAMTYKVYLRMEKPLYLEMSRQITADVIAKAKDDGYDGIITDMGSGTEYVVFNPNQIKSVFNRGTFDPESANILYQAAENTSTPEFQNWWNWDWKNDRPGDKPSAVVDENGKPMSVFHGTGEDIEQFDKALRGSTTGAPSAEKGFFFTKSRKVAEGYAEYARPKYIIDLNNKQQQLEKIAQRSGSNSDWDKYYRAYEKYEQAELDYVRDNARTPTVIEAHLSMNNPLEYDFKGEPYREVSYNDLVQKAIENGNDGVILRNTYDAVDEWHDEITDIFVVFNSEQVKSTSNSGAYDPKNANILKQQGFSESEGATEQFREYNEPTIDVQREMDAPMGKVPLNGTPTTEPFAETLREINSDYINPILTDIQSAFKAKMGDKAFNWGDVSEADRKTVRQYLNGTVTNDLADVKRAAMTYGDTMRNNAMLDYSRRYGFDNYLNLIFPYQFWYTRSMMNWAKRAIDKPSWFAMYARLQQAQERMERDGMPTRLKGKTRFNQAWMPEWMGGGLWTDPMQKLFPFDQFGQPFEQYSNNQNQINKRAESIIDDMRTAEKISSAEAQEAIDTRAGSAWERAVSQAEMELDKSASPLSLATMMMTPALWWTIPYNIAQGEAEKISVMPVTRTGQTMKELGRDTFIEPLTDLVGGIMAGPETAIRKKAGLSEFGQWGDYYVDRTLAGMAADGEITAEQARIAMIQRSGDAFAEAYRRVQTEQALRTPGAAGIMALKETVKNKEGIATVAGQTLSGFLAGMFGGGLFSEGELKMRGLKPEYDNAWRKFEAGDDEAINTFFDNHPEYYARLALYDEPEERLHQFLVDSIWKKYMDLDVENRRLAREALGDEFLNSFLNKETRSYDAVSDETLARWSQTLGKSEMPEQVANVQGGQVEYYDQAMVQAITTYKAEKERLFPNIAMWQEQYFALPAGAQRKAFLNQYPKLKQYWDWKDNYAEQHPEIVPYFDELKNNSTGDTLSSELTSPLIRQLLAYATGGSLTSGAKSEIERIRQMYAPDMDEDEFLLMILSLVAP